jgi:hypothetical protein
MTACNSTLRSRFESKIERIPIAGCWIWMGGCNNYGYGRLCGMTTHRLAWRIYRGDIRDGAHVLHRCDIPCCTNPDHLFIGDFAANMKDKCSKGRQSAARGERQHNAKLTADQVRKIRNDTRIQRVIAAEYGVSQNAISLIKSRINWRHSA